MNPAVAQVAASDALAWTMSGASPVWEASRTRRRYESQFVVSKDPSTLIWTPAPSRRRSAFRRSAAEFRLLNRVTEGLSGPIVHALMTTTCWAPTGGSIRTSSPIAVSTAHNVCFTPITPSNLPALAFSSGADDSCSVHRWNPIASIQPNDISVDPEGRYSSPT